jgi:D-psicose/D-tagatose/L-ribulose 3-epimerase
VLAAAAGKLGYAPRRRIQPGRAGPRHGGLDRIFGALREVDYRGTITFESFSSEVVHPTLSANLSIRRNLLTDSMELAPAPVRTYYGA